MFALLALKFVRLFCVCSTYGLW